MVHDGFMTDRGAGWQLTGGAMKINRGYVSCDSWLRSWVRWLAGRWLALALVVARGRRVACRV